MIKNYSKLALRNLLKHKGYSFLNITGLAVGIACFLLILIYVAHEFSYDQHFSRAERIYRLNAEYTIGDKVDRYANCPRPIAPNMKEDFPEVLQFARIVKHNRLTGNPVLLSRVETRGRELQEDLVFYADSTFFELFDHSFLIGDSEKSLTAPQTVVITERIAHSIFGGAAQALGQQITIDASEPFRITGVIADPQENTHLDFEVLISWATFHSEIDLRRWLGGHVFSYLLLTPNHDISALLDKWPGFFNKYMKSTFDRLNGHCQIYLQKLTDIHLHSNLQWEVAENGSLTYVYVFLAIGVFILLIACINYMNIATARSSARATEVGIRKVFGADRKLIRTQFLTEAASFTVMAILAALILVRLMLPAFNDFTGKALGLNPFSEIWIIPALLGIGLFVSLLSGLYPAFFLASFRPAKVLREKQVAGNRKSWLRQTLVVLQFAISIVIISSTGVVKSQLDFTREKDLGFDKENIMVVTLRETIDAAQIPAIKSQLLQHPRILAAATSYQLPGKDLNHTAMEIKIEDGAWQQQTFQFMQIDYDFVDLMKMQLAEGRDFDKTMATDETAVIINQAAVDKFGWRSPVGRTLRWVGDTNEIKIIGVVNDFHVGSLHNTIEPIVLTLSEKEGGRLFLRLAGANIVDTVNFIENQWREYDPVFPINYLFLDQNFYKLHETDQKLAEVFGYFALLAVFISCLGLVGLASFTTEQRTKEIGVRKVLGATAGKVVVLIWQEFLILVAVANLIAWPAAYWVMERWLASFAYRTGISWQPFVLAGFAALIVATLVISLQSLRAAFANPIDSLRYE